MNHSHSDLRKQVDSQGDSKQDLKIQNQTHQLNNNLKKIISLSAGCTLFTGLANVQSPVVYACDSLEDSNKTDCQKTEKHDVDENVTNLNSPSVQQNLNVQWSASSGDSAKKPILVSDGSAATDEVKSSSPKAVQNSSQHVAGKALEPLPTSTRIYGDTIDLNGDLSAADSHLSVGDTGDAVRALQERLNAAGFTVNVDGIFGHDTEQAVREFQESKDLPQDGIVGSETSALIFSNATSDNLSPTAGVVISSTGLQNIAMASSQETDYINDDANVSVVSRASVGINKSITQVFDPNGSPDDDGIVDEAGDLIRYSIKVKNAGNVTLTGVTVEDPLTDGILMANGILPVGEEQSFDVTYTVTQSDIDNNGSIDKNGPDVGLGSIDNKATVNSDQTAEKSDSEAVSVKQTPALRVNKSAVGIDTKNDGRLNSAGDIIEYIVTVENTGNQTLTNVSVDDPQLGQRILGQLAPGTAQNFTARYRLTQDDIDNNGGGDGDIDNTVEVTTDQTGSIEDFAEVPVEQNPDIKVEKRVIDQDGSGDGTLNNAGETVTYEVIVTNTGNQTLTNVSIQDSLLSSWIVRDLTLAPGERESYTYTYVITQSDLDNNLLAMKW